MRAFRLANPSSRCRRRSPARPTLRPARTGSSRSDRARREWEYSGGGYTLLQLLIEDVTGRIVRRLHAARGDRAARHGALDVRLDGRVEGSTLADVYDVDCKPATHYRFTAGRSDPSTRRLRPHPTSSRRSYRVQSGDRGARRPAAADPPGDAASARVAARRRHLGARTILYAPNRNGGHVIGHDGDNDPAINTAARLDPASGDGIVVLETGNRLLATPIAGEWVFWQTGDVDILTLTIESESLLKVLAAGWIAILLAASIVGWRSWRAAARSPHRHAEGR